MILGASEMQGKSSHQGVGLGESGDEEIVYVCVCVCSVGDVLDVLSVKVETNILGVFDGLPSN